MKTSVELQKPLSFALWPIIVLAVLASIMIIGVVVYIAICKHKKAKPIEQVIIKQKPKPTIEAIKAKYLEELNKIEKQLASQKITIRTAYHKTSKCIRKFAHEVTGISVQNYTLNDIKMLNMPVLTQLIQEYYEPEFSKNSMGDADASIEKTKRAIEKWNLDTDL